MASRAPWAAREAIAHPIPSQDRDLQGNPDGNRPLGWDAGRLRENGGVVSLGVIVERLRSQMRLS